jgi:hypothetical protein
MLGLTPTYLPLPLTARPTPAAVQTPRFQALPMWERYGRSRQAPHLSSNGNSPFPGSFKKTLK